ncbi:methyl-accepting chemotaxis protein [Desulfosporosinus meridiei]|uniref:Methyl-accepting chemotaxis protein n=1 Tax=Desulfosporosinus meridiei (strain ATCC BAA-275 / DSM 13257 / KCTC 12902 / NCIMB 13706 / S10) TaxID=768704 RepID=J7IMS9_DESMD|nr:methyl-accepting chemotaxis protein [Desulfosporosinus meridiei]AFQ42870.1 methyl-accepting chemotaxis protein [Desulfosporosinus meridiei DSM 13257]
MNIKSIQTKLLLLLLPLVIVALGVLTGVSYHLSKQSLTKSVDQTARSVGTDYSYRVKADIELMISRLIDLANLAEIRTGTNKEQMVRAMADAKERFGTFDAVVFVAPDGSGLTSTGSTAPYGDRDYFKKVIETKQTVVSDPLVSKSTGKLAVVLAVPVLNNEQLSGVLVGTFSVERLSALIKDLKFLDTGYGQIADDSGTIIAHPHLPEVIGKLNLREKTINPELKLQKNELDDHLVEMFESAADSGTQISGGYTFVDGVARIAVFTPVELPGGQRWIMTVAAPEGESTRETASLTRTLLMIALVSLLATGLSIVMIANRFTKPILLIREECQLLAQGDFRVRETGNFAEDEIGQLANGFLKMGTNLRDMVSMVSAQAEQLAAASEELTASVEQSAQAANLVATSITEVATGAEDQLSSVNDTASVVEEMSASIQQVSATTSNVAGQSVQAANKANEGNISVNKAVSQMAKIEQTVNDSAKAVTELGERSKEIGQIIVTISGIAEQTNLLALNAAIEAARAGEQGRGFAVVADEVRKLAEQSQEATQQISSLISEIQEDTDKAVFVMDNGTREVALGAEVVNTAGQIFQEIAELVTNTSGEMKEIATTIDQMAIGSQQIVESVNKIDDLSKMVSGEAQTVSAATEEQSASMEEISSSSQSLATLAQNLQEAVNKFRF